MFDIVGTIECISLVTRIVDKLDLLNQHTYISYIPSLHVVITAKHFVQGHILRHGPNHSLIIDPPLLHS